MFTIFAAQKLRWQSMTRNVMFVSNWTEVTKAWIDVLFTFLYVWENFCHFTELFNTDKEIYDPIMFYLNC